jgi:hypothetical protein
MVTSGGGCRPGAGLHPTYERDHVDTTPASTEDLIEFIDYFTQ